MSKFLHDDDDDNGNAKATAMPWDFILKTAELKLEMEYI